MINSNDKISNKIKKKNEILLNRKIQNRVTDMHWKTIKYLTDNYDCIRLGDMSSRDIVKKSSSVLSKIQKTSCLRTGYYVFQERLKFKCMERGINYKLVNEYNTSKTCSQCGLIKNDLGKKDIYECDRCKLKIDRDVNGARNIYFNSI